MPLYTAGEGANRCSHYGNQYGSSLKQANKNKPPHEPAIPPLGGYSKKSKTAYHRDAHTFTYPIQLSWHVPIVPELGSVRHKSYYEFKSSLGYTMSTRRVRAT